MGLREHVGLAFDKVLNRGNVWEGFHAELAIEAAAESVENLVFLLGTMPN